MACMTSLVVRRTDVSDLGFGACPVRLDVPLLDDYLVFPVGAVSAEHGVGDGV